MSSKHEALEVEDINAIWSLLQQKDDDLRRAAELGKMLLDEKEADAQAYEAEKQGLWRRVEEMTARIKDMEDEMTEARSFASQASGTIGECDSCNPASSTGAAHVPRPIHQSDAEEALREHSDALQEQLARVTEQLEEARLEVVAVRKAQARFGRRGSGCSWSDSARSSLSLPTRRGRASSSTGGGGGGGTLSPTASTLSTRCSKSGASSPSEASLLGSSQRASGRDQSCDDDRSDDDDAASAVSEEALVAADRLDTSYLRKKANKSVRARAQEDEVHAPEGMARESDNAWLAEQNAWLLEELDAKDELIEALRGQLLRQRLRLQGYDGGRGLWLSPSDEALGAMGEGSGDDGFEGEDKKAGREDDEPSGGVHERSFLDDLGDTKAPSSAVTSDSGTSDTGSLGNASIVRSPAPEKSERRRSFGEVLMGNVMLGPEKRCTGKGGGNDRSGDDQHKNLGVQANNARPSGDIENSPPQAVTGAASPGKSCPTLNESNDSVSPNVPAYVSGRVAGAVTEVAVDQRSSTRPAAPEVAEGDADAVATSFVESCDRLADEQAQNAPAPLIHVAEDVAPKDGVVAIDDPTEEKTNEERVSVPEARPPQASESAPEPPPAEHPAPKQNRAERKSRLAMGKLGLRPVKEVFRMSMKTADGALFVIRDPDVFRHPHQSTYVVFGATESARKDHEKPAPAAMNPADIPKTWLGLQAQSTAQKQAAFMSPGAVDTAAPTAASVAIGTDRADVITVVSHTGCSHDQAVSALREAQGDVVNAVMQLTEA